MLTIAGSQVVVRFWTLPIRVVRHLCKYHQQWIMKVHPQGNIQQKDKEHQIKKMSKCQHR
ncbi:hypothetical protein C5167_034722 [Papaver somniferum]|uniref:Uncharacterized protein n=1 Tax=Papaver somniferum TaxID=3469 RepID=A0A4Y7KH46_PAPSO|nr:hypothetical protein C5167_034722 [Papaver somniferum]